MDLSELFKNSLQQKKPGSRKKEPGACYFNYTNLTTSSNSIAGAND